MSASARYRWLFVIPSFAVGVAVTVHFWKFEPTSDGAVYLNHAKSVWQLPFSLANFTERPVDFRYVSMSLLGLTYHLGIPSVAGVKCVQLLLYGLAILALYSLSLELFPMISYWEAGLSVLIFAISPAYLAYLVGVALDFVALTFHLWYLLLLLRRRWMAAALAAIAFGFSKENGFLVYAITLPVALWWSLVSPGGSYGAKLARPLPLLAPLLLHLLLLGLDHRSLLAASDTVPECGATGWTLLLSPNLGRIETQNYFFDLFVLSFQWLLLIPIGLGTVRLALDRPLSNRVFGLEVDRRKFTLIALFLLAWIWAFTRCPLYNNVKYVLNAMPLWLLVSLVLARAAFPSRWMRVPYLLTLLAFFGVSAIMTVDPLSRYFYGTGPGGPLLCLASRTKGLADCGNDELVYNLQRFM